MGKAKRQHQKHHGKNIRQYRNQVQFEVDVDARYDIMKLLPDLEKKAEEKSKSGGSDVLALIVILVVVGGICFGISKARNTTK